MAKSDSKLSTYEKDNENEGQNDDQQATTSRGAALKAGNTFDNMDDLKPIDFNSADTVRQTMKAIFAGRVPPPFTEEVNQSQGQGTSASIKINELARGQFHPIGQYIRSVNPSRNRVRDARRRKQKKAGNRLLAGTSNLKRRGRPPGAGSKKPQTISDMYLGKLSNVVPFRRRWQSESDSDVESAVLY